MGPSSTQTLTPYTLHSLPRCLRRLPPSSNRQTPRLRSRATVYPNPQPWPPYMVHSTTAYWTGCSNSGHNGLGKNVPCARRRRPRLIWEMKSRMLPCTQHVHGGRAACTRAAAAPAQRRGMLGRSGLDGAIHRKAASSFPLVVPRKGRSGSRGGMRTDLWRLRACACTCACSCAPALRLCHITTRPSQLPPPQRGAAPCPGWRCSPRTRARLAPPLARRSGRPPPGSCRP